MRICIHSAPSKTNRASISLLPNRIGKHTSKTRPTRSAPNFPWQISTIAACAPRTRSRLCRWLRRRHAARREADFYPQQRSWQASERIFTIIQAQGLSKESLHRAYRAWIARYPDESSLYGRFLQFLVSEKEYSAAGQLIADYRKQFPQRPDLPREGESHGRVPARLEFEKGYRSTSRAFSRSGTRSW